MEELLNKKPADFKITIDEKLDGSKISFILRNVFGFSGTLIKRIKFHGILLKNGIPTTAGQTVSSGDFLEIFLPDEHSKTIVPFSAPLNILYEDEQLLAVDKPCGMAVHPSPGDRYETLANLVVAYFSNRPFVFRPVTRLDKYTSGIVIIAKNAASAAKLCEQLKNGEFMKEYIAKVSYAPEPPDGTITAPIARKEGSVLKRCVDPSGKPSVTHYRTLKLLPDGGALVKAIPKTGRTHQIRVHLAHIGCPLTYDFLYGTETKGKHFFLRCTSVSFIHPESGKIINISVDD